MRLYVPDTTDVGTLQPDEPAIKTEGTEFLPLAHPMREAQVTCSVDSHNTFDLFQLFFSNEQLQVLVDNTNKNAHKARKRQGAHGGGTNREGREIRLKVDRYKCEGTLRIFRRLCL